MIDHVIAKSGSRSWCKDVRVLRIRVGGKGNRDEKKALLVHVIAFDGVYVLVETASEKATVPSISSPLTLSAQRSVLVAEPTLVC